MTILAVVGLTASIVIVTTGKEACEKLKEEVAKLREENAQLQIELDARDLEIATLRKVNAQWQDSVATLVARIDSLSKVVADLQRIIIGASPCLGMEGSKPRVLLRIVVNKGYRLEARWPRDNNQVAEVPLLEDAVSKGQLDSDAFEQYASAIYHHGEAKDTFGGSCRFFVELDKDTDSYPRFAQAVGVVNRYFLLANPSKVNRILAAGR